MLCAILEVFSGYWRVRCCSPTNKSDCLWMMMMTKHTEARICTKQNFIREEENIYDVCVQRHIGKRQNIKWFSRFLFALMLHYSTLFFCFDVWGNFWHVIWLNGVYTIAVYVWFLDTEIKYVWLWFESKVWVLVRRSETEMWKEFVRLKNRNNPQNLYFIFYEWIYMRSGWFIF